MFVVGTGEGATGAGFPEMPDFSANFALASAISQKLEALTPGFMRNTRVKTGRYNQHVSNQCLLVEVGHNANTFEQALNAMDYLAAAIADIASAGVPNGPVPTSPAPSLSPAVASTPTPSATPELTPLAEISWTP